MDAQQPLPLVDCPIGLFWSKDGTLCLKTEYGDGDGRIDAYIVPSGEFFWGGARVAQEQRQVLVTPVPADLVAQLTPPAPEPAWTRNDDTTLDLLALIDIKIPLPDRPDLAGTILERRHRRDAPTLTLETLSTWSDEEIQAAEKYAGACYAVAGDIEGVVIPPRPPKLAPFQPYSRWNPLGYGSPKITLCVEDQPPQTVSLAYFLEANGDGIDGQEAAEIADALGMRRIYRGGGGAGPAWTVQIAPYDYVRQTYKVDPVVGARVRHQETGRSGVVAPESASAKHHVHVLFDGDSEPLPSHPTALDYAPGDA